MDDAERFVRDLESFYGHRRAPLLGRARRLLQRLLAAADFPPDAPSDDPYAYRGVRPRPRLPHLRGAATVDEP